MVVKESRKHTTKTREKTMNNKLVLFAILIFLVLIISHLITQVVPQPFAIILSVIIGWNIGKLYMPLCRWLDSEPMPEEPIEDDGDDNEKR
jgi:hypothetical protein